jgi:soluble lytic murein transglycosylase
VEVPAAPVRPPVASPGGAAERQALFANAFQHIESGDFGRALPLLEALGGHYPELDDYVLFYLAMSHARTGNDSAAFDLWQGLAESHPRSLLAARSLIECGRIARRRGNLEQARALLRFAAREETAETATYELGEVELAAGDVQSAYEHFSSVRRTAPGSALGNDAKRRVLELRSRVPALAPRGAALEEELDLLLREGDHRVAIATADTLLSSRPENRRPAILRKRADAERGAGDLDRSLATLQEIVQRYPDSADAPPALYRRGSLLWNRDRDAEAKDTFLEYLRRYPGRADEPSVLYALARIEQSAGRDAEAIAGYGRLLRAYPASDLAAEGRFRIGWILYRQGRWTAAADTFGRLATGPVDASAEVRYWQARALERAGERQAAAEIYRQLVAQTPDGYYAHWAERRLGKASTTRTAAISAPADETPINDPPAGTDSYHLVRARELRDCGLRRLARKELKAFEASNAGAAGLDAYLVEVYPGVDGYRDAIRVAYASGQRRPEVFYPLAFWPIVTQQTAGRNLDPLLVLALMRQESLFDPVARSPADARGLMQLLPSTAERVAERHGRPAGDLYDPKINVPLGVAYLDELLNAYGGDAIRALAAYNGGESALARWEHTFGHLEPDEFVESITYRETRDYVKKVLANHRRYLRIYGAGR